MLNRLLQKFYRSPNNGKQVGTLPDGRRFLCRHSEIAGPCAISICVSSTEQPHRNDDFGQEVLLIGGSDALAGADAPGYAACALCTPDDRLHLVWTTEGRILHASAPIENVLEKDAWSESDTVVEGDVWLGDFCLLESEPCAVFRRGERNETEEGIGIAKLSGEQWQTSKLWTTGPIYPPVVEVMPDGGMYLAWGDVPGQLWLGRVSSGLLPAGEPQMLDMMGRQPSMISVGDALLMIYEDEYPHVQYLLMRNGERVQGGPLTIVHHWFTGDLVHSPQLCRDRFGVPWLFFVDNTRKSTFWARWMGEGFSEFMNGPRIYYRPPYFDWNLLPIGRLSLEKECTPISPEIGMLLTLEPPLKGQEYRSWNVPEHPTAPGSKVLFFDRLEVAETRNIRISVNAAVKHQANPLLDVGPPDAFDSERVFNHGAVIKDGDRYRMWYGAIHTPEQHVPWWDTIRCGYAESDDGVIWQKVNVGQVEWKGSTDNNIVPHLRHAPLMIRDDNEPDPQRRYKSLYVWNSGEMGEMARTGKYGYDLDPRKEEFPAVLFTSPDGLHFTVHDARIVFAEDCAKPFSAIPECFFFDMQETDPSKRWKAYGFMSLNLRRRGTVYFYSADGITWHTHPEIPVLDPSVRGTPAVVGGPESQIHDTVVFPYEGYYIALYQNQYDASFLDIELAVSRDAETFVHVNPGEKVIERGANGAWDRDYIIQTVPVFLDDEIRIYFGGGHYYEPSEEDKKQFGSEALKFQPGLATLRKDGFTAVSLEPGWTEGRLSTVPFSLSDQLSLFVNAECGNDGNIRVEVIDGEKDEALPGFSAEECRPLTSDELAHEVTWDGGEGVPIGRPIRLRFHLLGKVNLPRLFSYSLR